MPKNFSTSVEGLSLSTRTAFLSGLASACHNESWSRKQKNRSVTRTALNKQWNRYTLLGRRVCWKLFMALCGVRSSVLSRVTEFSREMFTTEFIKFDERRGGQRLLGHIISDCQSKTFIEFLDCFAKEHAWTNIGRDMSSTNVGLQLQLPYSCTYTSM